MDELLRIFLQSFIIALSGAMMPGPLLTYNIQLACKKGFWVGPQLILGHAFLEIGLIAAIVVGLGGFMQLTAVKLALWIVGGGLLLWMGWDLIRKEARNATMHNETCATAETRSAGLTNLPPIGAGIVISLVNPYWSLWWVTIGMGFISQAITQGWLGVTVFFGGHILADLGWYSLVSAAVAGGRQFLSDQVFRWILRLCGAALIFIAARFFLDAANVFL